MTPRAEWRALQGVLLVGGVVPVAAGALGVVVGPAAFGADASPAALSSHVAYLSGLLLAIGIGFWSCVPRIAARGPRIRLLAAIVVAGGLARLWSLGAAGVPPLPHVLALGMELGVTPGVALWHARLGRRSQAGRS